LAVRRALARRFVGIDEAGHTWRGRTGAGEAIVMVDVLTLPHGHPYVVVAADVLEAATLDGTLAQVLVCENGEIVLGRFVHRDGQVRIEHAILAGTTMDPVEVQASVWTVGWAADAFRPRMAALATKTVPPPAPPQTPAALRRDAHGHVEITERRVKRFLDERYGGFEHDPAWGYHGAFGSARVFVDVLPVLETSTAVRASSPVLSDIDLSEALALRLLALAADGAFGRFLYVPSRREIWFEHVVLGDDLDPVEFETALEAVARIADGSDEALRAEFGGKRYADLG
jgi:hypothetical protein